MEEQWIHFSFLCPEHTENVLIVVFLLTLKMLRPVIGGKERKMRAHAHAGLRFYSSNLVWKLQFDKIASVLFLVFVWFLILNYLHAVLVLGILLQHFEWPHFGKGDQTRSPQMALFNIKYSVVLDQFNTGILGISCKAHLHFERE